MQRHLVFGHAHADRLDAGRPTDVGDARHFGDVGDFFGRLHHAPAHGGGRHVDEFGVRKGLAKLAAQIEAHMVELDADAPGVADEALDGGEVIVFRPVGIGDVVAGGAPPWLATVDGRRHRGRGIGGHHEAVLAPELAVEEVGQVADRVIGGEQAGIDPALGHDLADAVLAAAHFAGRKRRLHLVAIMAVVDEAGAVAGSGHGDGVLSCNGIAANFYGPAPRGVSNGSFAGPRRHRRDTRPSIPPRGRNAAAVLTPGAERPKSA